jgi:hypothetical protein
LSGRKRRREKKKQELVPRPSKIYYSVADSVNVDVMTELNPPAACVTATGANPSKGEFVANARVA